MPNLSEKEKRIINRKLLSAVEENNLQEVEICLKKGRMLTLRVRMVQHLCIMLLQKIINFFFTS